MTITGEYKNGVIVPHRPLALRDGQTVTIMTEPEQEKADVVEVDELRRAFRESASGMDEEWMRLSDLVQRERDEDLDSVHSDDESKP